jgi:hypothetical protein
MSEFRIDQITNQSGSRGPDIAGITTFTGTSGMVMPSGPTEYRGGRGRGLFGGGTRGVFGSWRTKTPTVLNINTIDYITIATLGDALDFGDLVEVATANAPSSNSIRGIWGGGQASAGNIIQYITIASTGNAQDFGDLNLARSQTAGTSNSTRGVFAGGSDPSSVTNTIEFVTISTLGNAADFGDLTLARRQLSGLSDAHGGLG